jgi:hypothetical protein
MKFHDGRGNLGARLRLVVLAIARRSCGPDPNPIVTPAPARAIVSTAKRSRLRLSGRFLWPKVRAGRVAGCCYSHRRISLRALADGTGLRVPASTWPFPRSRDAATFVGERHGRVVTTCGLPLRPAGFSGLRGRRDRAAARPWGSYAPSCRASSGCANGTTSVRGRQRSAALLSGTCT